jgi:hypothetical protein
VTEAARTKAREKDRRKLNEHQKKNEKPRERKKGISSLSRLQAFAFGSRTLRTFGQVLYRAPVSSTPIASFAAKPDRAGFLDLQSATFELCAVEGQYSFLKPLIS